MVAYSYKNTEPIFSESTTFLNRPELNYFMLVQVYPEAQSENRSVVWITWVLVGLPPECTSVRTYHAKIEHTQHTKPMSVCHTREASSLVFILSKNVLANTITKFIKIVYL